MSHHDFRGGHDRGGHDRRERSTRGTMDHNVDLKTNVDYLEIVLDSTIARVVAGPADALGSVVRDGKPLRVAFPRR